MATQLQQAFSVKGKTALITGASSGLGYQFALHYLRDGANVVVAARRADRLNALVEEAEAMRKADPTVGQAKALVLDVAAEEAEIDQAVAKAWSSFGRVDIVVNTAGVSGKSPLVDDTAENFDRIFRVNVRGAWLVTKAAARLMAKDNLGGSIIFIGSCVGNQQAFAVGWANYSASKATLAHLTLNLASELGHHNIRVNTIAPGLFPTEMTAGLQKPHIAAWFEKNNPVNRMGNTTKDLYGPLLLFSSDAGAYITGTTLIVDGGLMLLSKNFTEALHVNGQTENGH